MIAAMIATSHHDTPRFANSTNREAYSMPTRLSRRDIGGPFSLIDRHPVAIDAVPGLVVHVVSGSLAISRERYAVEHIVRAGKRFEFHGSGPLVLRALSRVELRIEWPSESREPVFPRFLNFAEA